MEDLSRRLEKQARPEQRAHRRAFESYLRYGRVPEAKALGSLPPTTHYVWRTARDERVRSAHAANEGRMFAWNNPPATGHRPADVPIMAFEAWDHSRGRDAAPVMTGTLTKEQVRQFCRRLPEVQAWTNEAATLNLPQRLLLGPQRYGIAVHQWVKLKIEALRLTGTYGDLRAEYSIVESSVRPVDYGMAGSTRLDVFEDRRPEIDMVCVYDIKTGRAGLTPGRLRQISKEVNKHFGATRFIVIEIRPFE